METLYGQKYFKDRKHNVFLYISKDEIYYCSNWKNSLKTIPKEKLEANFRINELTKELI